MNIFLWDHNEGGDFVGSARSAVVHLRKENEIPNGGTFPHKDPLGSLPPLEELYKCSLVIAHVESSWGDLLARSPANSVRIRVSSVGLADGSPPEKCQNGPYVFHLRPPSKNVTVDEWNEIIVGLSDQGVRDALVRGENPNGLKKYFDYISVDVLSALSILCQGYLAVHAEKHGDDSQVSRALNQMGWSNNLMTNSSNAPADKVSTSGWWMKAFDGTNNLNEKAKDEWGEQEGWSEVEDLLEWITEEQKPRKGPKPRRIVATAYSKLAKRLGGGKS